MVIKARLRKDMESGYGHYIKYGTECDIEKIWYDELNNKTYAELKFKDGYRIFSCDIKNIEILEEEYKWMEINLENIYSNE